MSMSVFTGIGYRSKKRFKFYTAPPLLKDKFWREKSFHKLSRPKVFPMIRSFSEGSYMRKISYRRKISNHSDLNIDVLT